MVVVAGDVKATNSASYAESESASLMVRVDSSSSSNHPSFEAYHLDPFSSKDERDTSQDSTRSTSTSSSRVVTVNTHNSILNITEDDEDDDEEQLAAGGGTNFMLFEDEEGQHLSQILDTVKDTTPPYPKRCCEALQTRPDGSLLDSLTEQFAEAFCYTQQHAHQGEGSTADMHQVDHYRRLLESDIFDLLGCSSSPADMQHLWDSILNLTAATCRVPKTSSTLSFHDDSPARPRRRTLKDRLLRLSRVRQEQAMIGQGLSPTSTVMLSPPDAPIRVTRSLDEADLLFPHHPQDHDGGYDSDPGEQHLKSRDGGGSLLLRPARLTKPSALTLFPLPRAPVTIMDQVQETLNMSWNLTWHPSYSQTEITASVTSPTCRVWMERGTLVQHRGGTGMIEPTLMWRPAYQPMTQRRLQGQVHSIRLLNLCRILEATQHTAGDKPVPLARTSCSFVLKTDQHHQEEEQGVADYWFEASSSEERDDIVRRWKMVVARFATLAVMEDMEGTMQEFFTLNDSAL